MMRFVRTIQCSNMEILLIQCKCNCNNSACVIVDYILYFIFEVFTKKNGNPCGMVSWSRVPEGDIIPFLLPFCFSCFS